MALNDKNPDAHFNSGLCYAELGKSKEAQDSFKKVVEIDANYSYAYYALGITYEKAENYAEAIANYEKFIELISDKGIQNSVKAKINELKKRLLDKQ